MVFDGGAAMSWRDQEERTECAFSEDCNNVADDYVRSMSKEYKVCQEHKEELQEWIADTFAE